LEVGPAGRLLASAQIARRPLAQRVMVVVTIAIALLSFAATAWDVAAQAREERAQDAIGADRVLRVAADSPAGLVDALAKADPDGHSMAVVRASQLYLDGYVELIGVDSAKLADVAVWRGHDRSDVERWPPSSGPPPPRRLALESFVEVNAAANNLTGGGRLDRDRGRRRRAGPHGGPRRAGRPAAPLPRLAERLPASCRLIGLAVARTAAGGPRLTTDLRLTSVSTKGGRVDAASTRTAAGGSGRRVATPRERP
jgi:hypothetical protein